MTPNSLKPLYLIFNGANGYIEEGNGNMYLVLLPTDESKDKLKKYEEIWSRIKDIIRSINDNSIDYEKTNENQVEFR